ncbi:17044_t:CDS:1, partial [Dentiscutata heterogama]
MTQERVNNNSNYTFVSEDPSKPRKHQLNFHLSSEYVKDLKYIPVTAMDHHHNSLQQQQQQHQHNLRHADLLPNRQPASSITLPSIRELIQLPLPSINHQSNPHIQQDSIPLNSRPHLPPLQHSFDSPPPSQNPTSFNYNHNTSNSSVNSVNSVNDRMSDNHNVSSPDVAHYHAHH